MKNIRLLVYGLLMLIPLCLSAQDGKNIYSFLRFPSSSRVNALGGSSVSLVEADPSLVFHNPALMGGEMDGMLNLNYMNYIAGINVGSAIYTKAFKERSSIGFGATYINYGTMKETDENQTILGDFSASNIGLMGFYSYDLSDSWRGGVSMKLLYSAISDYTSFGIGVDVGLSYYDPDRDFSYGVTLKNVGTQLKSYDSSKERFPWDLQMGISKRIEHAPIRVSITGIYLNKWKIQPLDETETEEEDDSFFKTLTKHIVLGVDLIPSDNFWLGVGFSPKAKSDMKLESGNGLGGFSIGAGLKLSKFDVGISAARYHPSATSLLLSLTIPLSKSEL